MRRRSSFPPIRRPLAKPSLDGGDSDTWRGSRRPPVPSPSAGTTADTTSHHRVRLEGQFRPVATEPLTRRNRSAISTTRSSLSTTDQYLAPRRKSCRKDSHKNGPSLARLDDSRESHTLENRCHQVQRDRRTTTYDAVVTPKNPPLSTSGSCYSLVLSGLVGVGWFGADAGEGGDRGRLVG